MSLVYCQDRAGPPLDAHLTHQGFLRIESVIGRPGVLTYTQSDGTVRRELRLAEELQKAASLDTARGIPVTNGHPSRDDIPLGPHNIKQHEVGHIGESVTFDGTLVKAEVTVKDAQALRDIGKGKVQLSPAYFKRLEYTPGVWIDSNGRQQQYDAIQRDIRYDHVAIVQVGRAGSGVALGLSTDGIDVDPGPAPEGGTMAVQLSLDGGVQVPIQDPGVAGLITAAIQRRDEKIKALEATVAASGTKTQEMQASLDAKDAELVAAKEATSVVVSPEAVKARLGLERTASVILGDKVSLDEMSDVDVKRAVVAKVHPTLTEKVAAGEPSYVDASFDAACAHHESETTRAATSRIAAPHTAGVADPSMDTAPPARKLTAREKHVAKQRANRTKNPLELAAGK